MSERPSSGGRWIRDPETRALRREAEADQVPAAPAEAGAPVLDPEPTETVADAAPARGQKKRN